MKLTRTSKRARGQASRRSWPSLLLALSFAGCATAPMAGMEKEVKPADLEALKANGAKAGGLVVWTSSRAGTPHVFSMRTDGSDTHQLTKGDNTDWRPRFSPDGTKILFQRSRDADFVRESDANRPDAWDLYTVGVDGGDLQKVADNATWGSWFGPDEIVFLRGSKIMRKKLGAENETRVMDTARYPMFEGAIVQQPELSHDGHFVALTLAGVRRQVGIWSLKKKVWTSFGQGTQIGWSPDGASVYWIDDSGKEGRIAREPVVAGVPADDHDPDQTVLVDLGGRRSRERFPRLANDGKWLVFAAAITGLENDVEDYELFLWETGSSRSSATRLTFHTANDRWPDIFIGEPGKAAPAAAEAAKEPAEDKEPARDEEASPTAEKQEQDAKAAPAEPAQEAAPAASSGAETDEDAPPPPKAKKKKKHH
jgi:hypothetical protein